MVSPTIDAIPRSLVSQAHPVTRLQSAMQSMRNNLKFQIECQPERLSPDVLWTARDQMSDIDDMLAVLMTNSITRHTHGYDREKYLQVRKDYRGKFGDNVSDHLDSVFGDMRIRRTKNKDYHPLIKQMLSDTANNRACSRSNQWMARAQIEVQRADINGWFIALDTLTCTDEHMDAVFFGKDSAKIWTAYCRKIARACRASYHGGWTKVPKKGAPLSDYHRFIAVAEEGDLRGRPHIHVLHFMRALPDGVSDPNAGREHATEKDMKAPALEWEYGISKFRAFRLHGHDAYAKIGWRWPVEVLNGRVFPQAYASAGKAAHYVCKYIVKSYLQRTLSWRVKATQGLGTQELKQAIRQMPVKRLLPMTQIPPRKLTLRQVRIPGNLVKTLVQKEVVRRYLMKTKRAQRMILRFPALSCRLSLVRRYMTLMTRSPIPNSQSIGSFGTLNSNAMAVSELQFLLDAITGDYVEAAFYTAGTTR